MEFTKDQLREAQVEVGILDGMTDDVFYNAIENDLCSSFIVNKLIEHYSKIILKSGGQLSALKDFEIDEELSQKFNFFIALQVNLSKKILLDCEFRKKYNEIFNSNLEVSFYNNVIHSPKDKVM